MNLGQTGEYEPSTPSKCWLMTDISLPYNRLNRYEKIYQVVLVLLLVMSSGFPVALNNKFVDVAVFAFAAGGLIYFRPELKRVLIITMAFTALMAIQSIYNGSFYLKTAIYQVILFTGAAISVSILGTNLLHIYVRLMRVIAIVSLCIFIPVFIFPALAQVLIDWSPFHVKGVMQAYGLESTSHNILVMHFPPDFFYGLIRNSGPFWEPGAFGGFLLLAFMINTLLHNSLFRKDNIIFIATLISTFSTTTYLGFAFFVTLFLFLRINSARLRVGALACCAVIGVLAFIKVGFLGNKIGKEFRELRYTAFVRGGDTRMASAYLDLVELDSPFYMGFGRGSHPDSRIRGLDKQVLRTNGITDLLSRFGILFFAFAIFSLWKFFVKSAELGGGKHGLGLVGLATIMILSFSEIYFIYIFFKVLIVFPYLYSVKRRAGNTALTGDIRDSASVARTFKPVV